MRISSTLASVSLLAIFTANTGQGLAAKVEASPASDIVVTARREKTTQIEQAVETIAKYSDVNAAKALGRIPSVGLSIDTTERSFVNIRGLDGSQGTRAVDPANPKGFVVTGAFAVNTLREEYETHSKSSRSTCGSPCNMNPRRCSATTVRPPHSPMHLSPLTSIRTSV